MAWAARGQGPRPAAGSQGLQAGVIDGDQDDIGRSDTLVAQETEPQVEGLELQRAEKAGLAGEQAEQGAGSCQRQQMLLFVGAFHTGT